MTAEQIYKAYVGGLDMPTLARATGYGYAAIDRIINSVKHDNETAYRVKAATSSLRGYGSIPLASSVRRSGVSSNAMVAADTQLQVQQSPQMFQIPARIAIGLAQSIAGKPDRSDVTLEDLIGALFQLDLIKSIAWLPKEGDYSTSALYSGAVYLALKKPAQVLLPLVKDNKIDPVDAAAALKSPEAQQVARIYESWDYATPVALFKAGLSSDQRRRVRLYGTNIAESVKAQEKSDLATERGYTDLAYRYKNKAQQKEDTAFRVKTQTITDAALYGVNVDQFNALFDLTGAVSALGAAAAYRPSFTSDEEENAKTAQAAAVIEEATGAESNGSSTTVEDIVSNTENMTDGFNLPSFIVGEKGLTIGAKVGLSIVGFGLVYLLFFAREAHNRVQPRPPQRGGG